MRNQLFTAVITLLAFSSCHTLKPISVTTRDSVVVKYHDSLRIKDITRTKDSIVVHDSTIGIKGNTTTATFKKGSSKDTTIHNGSQSLHRYIDDQGDEHVDCHDDSLTLVINNLTTRVLTTEHSSDSLSHIVLLSATSHDKTVVKEQSLGFFGRLWQSVRTFFSWFGLLAFILLIALIVKRYVV